MHKVDIYIVTNSRAQTAKTRLYGYVLECVLPYGKTEKRTGNGEITGTYHETTLCAITRAIKRLNRKCQVCIHTEDTYVGSRIPEGIEKMAESGFKTRAGKPFVNDREWAALWEEVNKHQTSAVIGPHKYTERIMEGE